MQTTHAIIKTHTAHHNELLALLLAGLGDRIAVHLTRVDLPAGAVLEQTQRGETYTYFPNNALISLLCVIENGKAAEIGMVGSEGMVGIEGLTGGRNPYVQVKVQCAGTAFRLPTGLLRDEFNRHDDVRWPILRYMQSMIAQIGQAVICARHHSIEQQLCRKLLMSSDRLRSNTLTLTQGTIAEVLGVRREGVTAAAGALKHRGVIEYRRGHIRILDRAGLEARSCECYEVINSQCHLLRSRESCAATRDRRPPPRVEQRSCSAAGRHTTLGNAAA
ncbi:MAG: Crp/Fnr family transcriptional regulator [Gammaproteobacteria bacterium]|nr:Crp/Fnr family transcriptional regulator [Gammaproteobacteria bacterium]